MIQNRITADPSRPAGLNQLSPLQSLHVHELNALADERDRYLAEMKRISSEHTQAVSAIKDDYSARRDVLVKGYLEGLAA